MPGPSRFVAELRSGRVLLMDGALGTSLIRAGLPAGQLCERWTLTNPADVAAVHRSFAAAGAEVFVTNTFQANTAALARHGLLDRGGDLVRTAVRLAADAAGPSGFVLGSIGPGWSAVGPDSQALASAFRECPRLDGILAETWSLDAVCSPTGAGFLPAAVESFRPLPVLLSLTFRGDRTSHDATAEGPGLADVVAAAALGGVAALGVNCGRDVSIRQMTDVIRRLRGLTSLPLFARPNAGTPVLTRTPDGAGNEWVYPESPASMAATLPDVLSAGVAMVGGCCGTTPGHIAAFRPIIDRRNRTRGGRGGRHV